MWLRAVVGETVGLKKERLTMTTNLLPKDSSLGPDIVEKDGMGDTDDIQKIGLN